MRNCFISHIIDSAKQDKNTLLLTGDLGFGVLDNYEKELPRQFINAGIAEQNMMSVACGLSLRGKRVFVYSIGNFNTLRCIEQIRNDCTYHNANVKIVTVGAGLAYGALGMSHHVTEDIAAMRVLSNMTIFSPASRREVDAIFPLIEANQETCYIRLGKGGEREIHGEAIVGYKLGDPIVLKEKGKNLIIATGAIAGEAEEAVRELLGEGIEVAFATMPTLKPVNEEKLLEIMGKYSNIITVEEHSVIGGLGSIISDIIASRAMSKKLVKIGLVDTYASKVGDRSYLLDEYGLGKAAIKKKIMELR